MKKIMQPKKDSFHAIIISKLLSNTFLKITQQLTFRIFYSDSTLRVVLNVREWSV